MKQKLYLVLFGGLLLISCERTGCNDPLALNYDSKAILVTDLVNTTSTTKKSTKNIFLRLM